MPSSQLPLQVRSFFARLIHDRRGGGFVEYAIVVGVVALLGMTIFSGFRGAINGAVTNQGTAVQSLGNGLPTAR